MRLIVAPSDPRESGARRLIEASHGLMAGLFPPEDNACLTADDLAGPGIDFFTARQGDEILGTGALAAMEHYGEVKALFVDDRARGQGVGDALMRAIENRARALGLPHLRLETGNTLHPALRLYARHGFVERPPFGTYKANGTSIFMEKPLTPPG